MTSAEIRRQFLDYFAAQGHRVVRSSSLIPHRDPTLLFTNAGMNQFKDLFLGREKRDYTRAASSQKCVRAGGKHNDLENVGYTRRHLTFFEMLGNFSFGDYFKKDAIRFAWELVTRRFGLPPERLYATVFRDDDEAWQLWRDETGLPESRLSRLDEKDNFWSMGETGPCGPCSEIYLDTGAPGCGAAACAPGCDCDRFLEFWNLVFMQYDRDADGKLQPLPQPSVDTGMGLERIAMILQGVGSVYESDLLFPIIERTAALAGLRYGGDESRDVALRVIADHLRSSAFLLADGALPANEGRGYVLRRIIRRALRFGKRLGFERPFLHELSGFLVDHMGAAYPELAEGRDHIARVIRTEEERFAQALVYSGRAFDDIAQGLENAGERRVAGGDAFRLYDTFGLPLDTLKDMAEVRGLEVDEAGFQDRLEEARRTARASWRGGAGEKATPEVWRSLIERGPVRFVGYQAVALSDGRVVAVLRDGAEVAAIGEGEQGEIVLEETPFYPEGGGQVGDRGTFTSPGVYAQVEDTIQPMPGLIVHRVRVRQGRIAAGDRLDARVEESRRRPTMLNHSATHLMHAALRSVLGEHVKQAGSRVEPERLRFDFTHYGKVEADELSRIEEMVNRVVGQDDRVEATVMSLDDALKAGALAFFGDKYGDAVRVVRMGEFSMELCGGTHVAATGNIGYFHIVSEGGISSGVRRIEAHTGERAVLDALHNRCIIEELAGRLNVPASSLAAHVDGLRQDLRAAKKEVAELRLKLAGQGSSGAAGDDGFQQVGAALLAVRRVEGLDDGGLRQLADELRRRVKSGVVVLGTLREGEAILLVAVTADLAERVDAGAIVRELAPLVGGKGGGRKDMARGGGPAGERLDEALAHAISLLRRKLDAPPA